MPLTAALRRRLMRLRSTALPICRVTVKPNRGSCPTAGRPPFSWLRSLASSTNAGPAHRAPLRTRRNSPRFFSVVTPGVAPFAAFARALAIGHPSLPAAISRREALAALRTPPGDDRAAASRGHALAETMPALAHELARLIGPFHVWSPLTASPCRGELKPPQRRPQGRAARDLELRSGTDRKLPRL